MEKQGDKIGKLLLREAVRRQIAITYDAFYVVDPVPRVSDAESAVLQDALSADRKLIIAQLIVIVFILARKVPFLVFVRTAHVVPEFEIIVNRLDKFIFHERKAVFDVQFFDEIRAEIVNFVIRVDIQKTAAALLIDQAGKLDPAIVVPVKKISAGI